MRLHKRMMAMGLLAVLLVPVVPTVTAYAKTEEDRNFPSGITWEMTEADYWTEGAYEPEKVLMTKEEIVALNREIVLGKGTGVVDLDNVKTTLEVGFERFDRELYVAGVAIREEEYIQKFEEGKRELTELRYAVAVERADIKAWPTKDIIGYSATDPDDEIQMYALNVNEPAVARALCVVDGEEFYFCQTKTCAGWICGNNLAFFADKEQWYDAWNYEITDTDILVVTGNEIELEPSIRTAAVSEIKLMQGTVLKLVPEEELPKNVGERSIWFNHVVYMPTRDEQGNYAREYGLISKRCDVTLGFLDLTQENLLEVAFASLGDRYGWGGMLGANDCSAYTRAIYKCFGLELPRNTTQQQKVPGRVTDVSGMTEEEKQKFLETVPAGSLLYFPGHTMVYTGSKEGVGYTISATGSLVESEGDIEVVSVYSVILNPLTVRRKNGKTWLDQTTAVLTFGTIEREVVYLVQGDDSLQSIAEEVLGDAKLWTVIYEANKAQISNPDKIYVNQELIIPLQ